MKKILFGLLALVLIAGCSSKPAETTPTPEVMPTPEATMMPESGKEMMSGGSMLQCTMNSDEDMIVTTYTYVDNKITNVVVETSYSTSGHDIADLQKQIAADKEFYAAEKGLTFESSETDKFVIVKMTYDVASISDDMKYAIGLTDEVKTEDYYDINKVKATIENTNRTCEVK